MCVTSRPCVSEAAARPAAAAVCYGRFHGSGGGPSFDILKMSDQHKGLFCIVNTLSMGLSPPVSRCETVPDRLQYLFLFQHVRLPKDLHCIYVARVFLLHQANLHQADRERR